MKLTVFVPTGTRETTHIIRGSAVVGRVDEQLESWMIDFEGNKYKGPALKHFADKLARAADHSVTRYPTVARMFVPEDELEKQFIIVGTYDSGSKELIVTDVDTLTNWTRSRNDNIQEANAALVAEFEQVGMKDGVNKIALVIGAGHNKQTDELKIATVRDAKLGDVALIACLEEFIRRIKSDEKGERTQPS